MKDKRTIYGDRHTYYELEKLVRDMEDTTQRKDAAIKMKCYEQMWPLLQLIWAAVNKENDND